MTVLDWQHPAYRFWPARAGFYESQFPHGVFPWPDGDYYVFLTEDFRQGSFGHPWEQTLCVFGDDLVSLLRPLLDQILPVVRQS